VHPSDEQFSVTNDRIGWRELIRRLKLLQARAIGIEASGGYERGPSDALLEAGLPVRLVNPWKLRRFAQAAGVLAKSDRLDVQFIARFVVRRPSREVHRDRAVDHLAELVRARRQLVDAAQQTTCQIEHVRDLALRRLLNRRVRQLEHDILQLDQPHIGRRRPL
jgi:transposase